MRIRPIIVAALIAASLSLVGCSSAPSATPVQGAAQQANAALPAPDAPQRVDAATFSAAVATPGVTVVDVRRPDEFAAGHIANAVNIDVEGPDFATQIAALDPAKTYAVYCRAGNRSQVAVAQLSQAGFAHIYELETGINGWTAAGYPVVQ